MNSPDDELELAFEEYERNFMINNMEMPMWHPFGSFGNIPDRQPPKAKSQQSIRDVLQCAVDRSEQAGPSEGLWKALFGNTVAEVLGLALDATKPYADTAADMARPYGIGVQDAGEDYLKPAVNAAGNALIQGIAALQESGQITQLGLMNLVEQDAPRIPALAGADFGSGNGDAKVLWDIGQFLYEFAKCY